MCNCKEYKDKIEVAEGVIRQMGEPVYLMYQSRLPDTTTNYGSYIVGFLIGAILLGGLYFIKPTQPEEKKVENQPSLIEL